jgi:hypothetical protein
MQSGGVTEARSPATRAPWRRRVQKPRMHMFRAIVNTMDRMMLSRHPVHPKRKRIKAFS